jgi:NADPH-dependent glutamate synthase beta subunit-like oxidoreductase
MEARNYTGAARLIREKNPFGEVCGMLCAAERLCQRDCYRRRFAGRPVRIADLQRWVCAEAGAEGWRQRDVAAVGDATGRTHGRGGAGGDRPRVAVVGGGPAALTAACYLSALGCRVTLFADGDHPGGNLWRKSAADPALRAALQRESDALLAQGIDCRLGEQPLSVPELERLRDAYAAVYVAGTAEATSSSAPLAGRASSPGADPSFFTSCEYGAGAGSVVESVAQGRRAAGAIWRFLSAPSANLTAPDS